MTIGAEQDVSDVLNALLAEEEPLLREWVDEIVQGLPASEPSVNWLVEALKKVEPEERVGGDQLSNALEAYVKGLTPDLLAAFTRSMAWLLRQPPLLNYQHCHISERYRWLAQVAAQAVTSLIYARHPFVLENVSLSMLRDFYTARTYPSLDVTELWTGLTQVIQPWTELKFALFWLCVVEARSERNVTGGASLGDWMAAVYAEDLRIGPSDFSRVLADLRTLSNSEDQSVALRLAFAIYLRSQRPRALREQMRRAVAGRPKLEADLLRLLRPPTAGKAELRKEEARWKRLRQRRAAQELNEAEKSKEFLKRNLAALRGTIDGSGPTKAQHYLQQRLKNAGEAAGRWTDGNWESLVPEFGPEISHAFRDGAVAYWRTSRPRLLSEGADSKSTPFGSVFGLVGLAIEARETPNWALGLSDADADLATRYALMELNGFPSWLPELYLRHPSIVIGVFVREIAYELAADVRERESHYVLYDVSWSGQWMWDELGPALLPEHAATPRNAGTLRYMLNIIQGSSIPDHELAAAAATACQRSTDTNLKAIWFSAWVGVEPDVALRTLETYLIGLTSESERVQSVMTFATHLLGTRRSGASSRQGFRTVGHLKQIFLLLHSYVRRQDDIERAGRGVYSPELRDDAQDARDSIFTILRDMPGKEAFLALLDLSMLHPDNAARPWMAYQAKAKAEQDSDTAPWTIKQFVDFEAELERTPANHRQLWELALSRILDLKQDLEHGDTSLASILLRAQAEEEVRNFIGGWCRDRAFGRYSVPQEEELADARRPDLRFLGMGFDAPVPLELKIADKWTGPHLFERLETQLCGDYLRDRRSSHGLFILVNQGKHKFWMLPNGTRADDFSTLVDALRLQWSKIADRYPGVEDIGVIGIDLTLRGRQSFKR